MSHGNVQYVINDLCPPYVLGRSRILALIIIRPIHKSIQVKIIQQIFSVRIIDKKVREHIIVFDWIGCLVIIGSVRIRKMCNFKTVIISPYFGVEPVALLISQFLQFNMLCVRILVCCEVKLIPRRITYFHVESLSFALSFIIIRRLSRQVLGLCLLGFNNLAHILLPFRDIRFLHEIGVILVR